MALIYSCYRCRYKAVPVSF